MDKKSKIILSDNLTYLKTVDDECIDLIYIDPPFNTGKKRKLNKILAVRSENGLVGFGNQKYLRYKQDSLNGYEDSFDDFVEFMRPRLIEAHRILKNSGSIYVHLDYREVHYIKILMDEIFGRDNYLNQIVWHYDFGGGSKNKWRQKCDFILYYVKDKNNYTFNFDKVPRIPYMSPKLVGKEKAKRGKPVTSVWWNTIVPTNSKERTGYPTQKPVGMLRRIVEVSSNPGDLCLDFFAGSGSFGEVCLDCDRYFILVDNNMEAIRTMEERFTRIEIKNMDFS